MNDQEQKIGMISLRLAITGIILPIMLATLFMVLAGMRILGAADPYYGLCVLLFVAAEIAAFVTGRASRGTPSGRIGFWIGACSLMLSAVGLVFAVVWLDRGSQACPVRPQGTPGEAPDTTAESYYFNVAKAGWDTVIYINGNPVCRAGSAASVVQEMSPWMQRGPNSIRITTKRLAAHAPDCDIRFVKVTNATDPDAGETLNGIHDSPAKADHYEIQFEVVVSRAPATWLWQRAESLEVFTDADRARIAELVNSAADALARKEPRHYLDRTTPVWGEGPIPAGLSPGMAIPDEKRSLETLEALCSYPDFVVTVAPREKWEFLVGDRIVLVCRTPVTDPSFNNCILYAGHNRNYQAKSGERTWSISGEGILFLKVDGKWIMLAP